VAGVDSRPGVQLGLDGLDAGFVARPLVKVTPARLATWTACPRRYRMTYLDHPAPRRGGAWAHHTLGAVVHLALRALFDLAPAARTPDAAAAQVDRNWSDEGFRDRAQAAVHRDRARGWVADYAGDLDVDARPVGLERWVSVATPHIVAEGRVDRIDERGGELVIVDYKTGRHAPSEADVRDSRALALYAVAAERTLRRRCRRVELHHVPSGAVLGWEHDARSVARHVGAAEQDAADAARAAARLDRGGDPDALFPPRTSGACSTCDVRWRCPEGRAAAPELAPWSLLAP
jgi:putative RecB family exonuclease